MAHWIVNDFGKLKLYSCSRCKSAFNYRSIALTRFCPKCNEYIDHDFEEYEWRDR